LHHILRFAFRKAFLDVQQNQVLANGGTGNIVGTSGSHGTGTYYGNFHV
jgi:hypothetical protein